MSLSQDSGWSKTGDICLQNDIAEIYFIIDTSDIFVFTAYLGMAEILTDFPTGTKQKSQK